MAFNWFWRILIAIMITCAMFFFTSLGWIYVIIIVPAIIIMITSRRRTFIIIVFLSVFFMILIGSMSYLGYLDEMEITSNFFMMVYDLIIPSGVGTNWMTQLPLLFSIMLPVTMLVAFFIFSFTYMWKRDTYDKWLVEAFSFTLLTMLFIYTLICIFAVIINVYDIMKTNFVSLFIWELIFVWIPFYALFFMIYFALGYIFRRI